MGQNKKAEGSPLDECYFTGSVASALCWFGCSSGKQLRATQAPSFLRGTVCGPNIKCTKARIQLSARLYALVLVDIWLVMAWLWPQERPAQVISFHLVCGHVRCGSDMDQEKFSFWMPCVWKQTFHNVAMVHKSYPVSLFLVFVQRSLMDSPYPPTTDTCLKCIFSTICGFMDVSVWSCRASKLPVVTYTPASPPCPFWCVITRFFAFSSHLWIAQLWSPGSRMSIYLSDNLHLVNSNHGTTDLSHEERKPTNWANKLSYFDHLC